MQLNLNVFFLSFFSESVRKYISVKTHWYLYQFIDLQCKSIAGFYEIGVYTERDFRVIIVLLPKI